MKVFATHVNEDAKFVDRLQSDLVDRGVQVWRADRQVAPGESFVGRIKSAIESAEIIVVVVSRAALRSQWFRSELALAVAEKERRHEKRIIPILVEASADIPFFIRDLHYLDMSDEKSYKHGVDALTQAILSPRPTEQDALEREKAKLDFVSAGKQVLELEKLSASNMLFMGMAKILVRFLVFNAVLMGLLGGAALISYLTSEVPRGLARLVLSVSAILLAALMAYVYLQLRRFTPTRPRERENVK